MLKARVAEADDATVSEPSVTQTCPCCGRGMDQRRRDLRFGWPDAVFALPDRELTEGSWVWEDNPRTTPMMQVPGAGSFVRALLPVGLTDGFSITFGVWLKVTHEMFGRAYDLWLAPNYADLRLEGTLANAVAPWGLFGAPVTAVVRDPDVLPVCAAAEGEPLHEVLTRHWPHAEPLALHFR